MRFSLNKETITPYIKPLFILLTASVLIVVLIVSVWTRINYEPVDMTNWNELTTRQSETYIVYYDSHTTPAANTTIQVNNYLEVHTEALPLYLINSNTVSGSPVSNIDPTITPQMFIIHKNQIEHIITDKGTMSKVLLESAKDNLANFRKITLTNWNDVLSRLEDVYLVFYYGDDEISDSIHSQIEIYNNHRNEKLPLYLLNQSTVQGEIIDRIDEERTPQLLIVSNEEIEHFVFNANNIISALAESLENQLTTYRALHLNHFNQIEAQLPDRYMVYYYSENAYSTQIKTYGNDYNKLSETTLPLYFAFDASLKGDLLEGLDETITPQLLIITAGEIEAAITGPNAIIKIMEKASTSDLPVYKDDHLLHLNDRIFIEEDIYFIYYYSETSKNHETLGPQIIAFNESNPLNIVIHFADKTQTFGAPPVSLLELAFSSTILIVYKDGEYVTHATSVNNIQAILQSVHDETFDTN